MYSSLANAGQPWYSRRHDELGLSQTVHEAPAARPGPVGVRIRQRRRTEHLAPLAPPPQPVCGIDGVPGLVAQNAHQPIAVAALDLAHQAPLDAHQAPMRQIERNRDTRNSIGREPFGRQPAMRLEADAARRQFAMQALDRLREVSALDGELQVAESQAEQLLVRQRLPHIARAGPGGGGAYVRHGGP
jgi:hypothetical protein